MNLKEFRLLLERFSLLLPDEEKARLLIQHKPDCRADKKFDVVQRLTDTAITMFDPPVEYVSNLEVCSRLETEPGGHWGGPISYRVYFLKCKHCGAIIYYEK